MMNRAIVRANDGRIGIWCIPKTLEQTAIKKQIAVFLCVFVGEGNACDKYVGHIDECEIPAKGVRKKTPAAHNEATN